MRTTLTLEPDVAAEIDRLRRDEARSLKATINELLRLGLRARAGKRAPGGGKGFRTRTVSLGDPTMPIDDIAEVLAIIEGENHK